MHAPFLLEILRDLLPRHRYNRSILHRSRNLNLFIKLAMHCVLHQLSQHSSQRLSRSGFGNHAFALDHTAQRCDGANLGADELLYFGKELIRRYGRGWVVCCGECDESEWEVTFECVWDTDDAAFGDGWM